jgi:hypothetical protein
MTQTKLSDLTPEKIVEIAASFKMKACNVSLMCDELGISRTAWYEWKDKNPEFAQAIKDAHEGMCDMAETKLYQNLAEGKETSLIFFLKNKRSVEWHDRKEVDLTGNLRMVVLDDAD